MSKHKVPPSFRPPFRRPQVYIYIYIDLFIYVCRHNYHSLSLSLFVSIYTYMHISTYYICVWIYRTFSSRNSLVVHEPVASSRSKCALSLWMLTVARWACPWSSPSNQDTKGIPRASQIDSKGIARGLQGDGTMYIMVCWSLVFWSVWTSRYWVHLGDFLGLKLDQQRAVCWFIAEFAVARSIAGVV